MARDVGEMGEAVLRQWTAEVGIVANKSNDRDETAWDFILEWPVASNPAVVQIPLDQVPTPLKCLVQVKSTDQEINRCQVALKNWLYLVRNPWPTFFLVLHFDGMSQCQRAHLVHVGEDYIRETQRRLRLASTQSEVAKKRKPKLNKATMQFSWGEKDLLPSLDGPGLQSCMLQHINQGTDDYFEWKQALCRSVGYESGHDRLDFTVSMPKHIDIEQHFVDFDIGLVSHLEIDSAEFFDLRFDIPVSKEKFESGGRIEVSRDEPPSKGQIEIWISAQEKKLLLDCDVHLPTVFGPFVDPGKLRARFDAGDWMFVVPLNNGSSIGMRFNLPDVKEEMPLSKLYRSASVILTIQAALDAGGSIMLSASCKDKILASGKVQLTSKMSPSLVKWAHLIDDAWIVARHFEIEDKVRDSVESLARQNPGLFLAKPYVMPDPRWFKVSFWLEHSEPVPEAQCCIPKPVMVKIGNYQLQVAAGVIGTMRFTGNKRENQCQYEVVTNRTCKCFERTLYPGDGPGESYEKLEGRVSAHHEHEMGIVYIKI